MPSPHVVDLKKPEPRKPAPQKKTPPKASSEPSPPRQEKQAPQSIVYASWHALEFEKRVKSPAWYAGLAVFTVLLVVLMAFLKEYFAALLFAVAGVVLWLVGEKEPLPLRIAITSRGVEIADRTYLYGDLRSFWIFYDPPGKKELSLRSKRFFMPYIRAPLGEEDPAGVRRHLIRFVPEMEHPESVVDEFSEKIGF